MCPLWHWQSPERLHLSWAPCIMENRWCPCVIKSYNICVLKWVLNHWIFCCVLKDDFTLKYYIVCNNCSFTLRMFILNTLRLRQNGRHFADDIFKCIFLNENVWIRIKIQLKFVPYDPINNVPALVQIMAWLRPGDKSLSESMKVSLPMHICITRPQWVNI